MFLQFTMPKGNPIGSKSSLAKRSTSKKRKNFKETPSWAKDWQESEHDRDYSSKMMTLEQVDLSPPKQSASKRKIVSVYDTGSEEEYTINEEYIASHLRSH